jgi:hypothetical protein
VLQLLYPIGLLAAAGIIIPVIIHLWNIKNGRTLKIGSVSLLGSPSNQRSRNFRITDWPLLLLRCLLLVLIAFMLAQPLFKSKRTASEKTGWIVVKKEQLGGAWKKNRKEMDSLLQKGYEIHDFNTGFSRVELQDTNAVFSKPATVPLSYFSLIRQLDAEQAAGSRIYLYTDNSVKGFEGTQPRVNLDLKWKIFPADTSEVTWVAGAFNLNKDNIRKITAHSSVSGTYYKREDVKNTAIPGLTVDSGIQQVLIYADGLPTDAAYIKAAVSAIADFTGKRISVKEIRSFNQISNQTDLVFWLADKELNQAQLKKLPAGISFFNYAGDKTENIKSFVWYQSDGAQGEAALYQRKNLNGQRLPAVWTDGFGTPLLTVDSSAHIRHYRFYSRFNQEWTDLVWTNGLVMSLMPIVAPQWAGEHGFQESKSSVRAISAVPKVVNPVTANRTAAVVTDEQRPVSRYLWWIVLVTFLTERLIAYRKTEEKV